MEPTLTHSIFSGRRAALALATLAAPALLWAQVSSYSFSQSVETYTEITEAEAAYSLGVPVYWQPLHNYRAWVNNAFFHPDGQITNGTYLSGATGPGYPIGFDFTFNGDVFDVIGISNTGWISFGKSSDGNQAVWIYGGTGHSHGWPLVQEIANPPLVPTYRRNRVLGFGGDGLRMQDLTPLVPPGPVSSLRLATIGTAPNRVCVVQYKDFRNSYSTDSEGVINFQIRLNESDNSVEVRYGNNAFSFNTSGAAQVGLGGQSAADFNSRRTVEEEPAFIHDWNNTQAATASNQFCTVAMPQIGQPAGSGVPPVLGLNFKWMPPACPLPAWPLTVSNISYRGALLSWSATGADAFEYFVSDTNSVDGPQIVSGSEADPQAVIDGLAPRTMYYAFVRSICGGEPGPWSAGTPFRTKGGGMVLCNGTVMEDTYCSNQHEVTEWIYISGDAGTLRLEFLGGVVANGSLQIWDGSAPSGAAGFTGSGELAGHFFQATSGAMFIRLTTDAAACHAQDWFLPMQWRIGCRDCNDPMVNFAVVEDCANQQYSVTVDIFSLGSSASVRLDNDLGVPPTTVSTTGLHTVGPFAAGASVVVTVQNPDQPMCYSASERLLNLPCALADCGPTTYTYCYGDNEWMQRAFQGAGTQEIGIRFLSGTMGFGDNLNVYNSADPSEAQPTAVTSLHNTLLTSGAPSTDRTLVLELISNSSHSCADADPLYGTSQPWEYVVACYDGCTQPIATFTTVCVDQTHFNVDVNITQLGSTPSVTITNDGGVAAMTATATGTYTVGPFTSGTPVKFDVVGASVLCTWTSYPQDRNCVGIGIEEVAVNSLGLFPNPNDGRFTLELPEAMSGAGELQVLDLAGRMVAQQRLSGTAIQQVDLTALPNGLYTLLLRNNGRTFNGKVSIQH